MGKSAGKALYGALACFFCIGLLVSVAAESGGRKVATAAGSFKSMQGNSGDRPSVSHTKLDPFLGSKRRVPNGPDPIHNRRAGKSTRPPGRA